MKNIFIIPLYIIICLSAAGCADFLDRTPYNQAASKTVYKSGPMAEAAVIGVYANIKILTVTSGSKDFNWDALSRVIDPTEMSAHPAYPNLMGTIQSNAALFNTYWKHFYEGVARANDVINNIGGTEALSPEIRECRIAECKFLRAYYYYNLNVLWKGVPVYLENVAPEMYTRGRSSEEAVWKVILDDLDDAIKCRSLPVKYDKDDSDYGRITKGAAYAFRGKVYMWLKRWPEAEADFRNVGQCGFQLFNGSYADLFHERNEKCNEMVFSFTRGNRYSYYYGNWMTAGNGINEFYMNTNFVDSYQWADGRPFSFDDVIAGYGDKTPEERSVYFCRNNMTPAEITAMTAYGADMSQYNATGNEARILQAYTGRDPRMGATVIAPYTNYQGGFASGAAQNYRTRWPYRSENTPDFDLRTRAPGSMLYCIRKFVSVGKEYTNSPTNPVNIPIIRYADVLLSLAEAINEQGRTSDAVSFVNQVRKRAGVAELNSGPAHLAVAEKEDLRQRIMDEKHWELALEEQLYFEELRWGTWKEAKFAESNGLLQCWGAPVYLYSWGGDHYLKWAIPSAETERNRNLVQNDGWY